MTSFRAWGCAVGLTALFSLNALAGNVEFKRTGHEELDAIRQAIATEKTNAENYKLRLFMLKQRVCALQQMGAQTDAFLEVSEVYKRCTPWNLMHLGGQNCLQAPQRILPREVVSVFKPPAASSGVASSRDWCGRLKLSRIIYASTPRSSSHPISCDFR